MQRREAILLLREIGAFPEVPPFTCVYLKSKNRVIDHYSKDLELHVKTNRDAVTRKIIERVALKYRLGMRESSRGFLVIYTPKKSLVEITV